MLTELITSKTRLQLLYMFFLNQENMYYLRKMSYLLSESTNSLSQELIKLEDLQLLTSFKAGNRKYYRANVSHNFFADIRNMLLKEIGFDNIKDELRENIPGLSDIYVIGSYAQGLVSNIIDLALIGQNMNNEQISNILSAIELKINKRIRFIVLQNNYSSSILEQQKMFRI